MLYPLSRAKPTPRSRKHELAFRYVTVLDRRPEVGPWAPSAAYGFSNAHLGADVVKVEPPGGDAARRRGPFPHGELHPERSGLHLYINQAKRSMVVDWSHAGDVERFRRLAAAADALLVSGSPARSRSAA
jgi:crotonobetainyl-CoA:carnitine CoA-transferase CaiB-like acyl-CoA transferase